MKKNQNQRRKDAASRLEKSIEDYQDVADNKDGQLELSMKNHIELFVKYSQSNEANFLKWLGKKITKKEKELQTLKERIK
jgi:hypothetical protein